MGTEESFPIEVDFDTESLEIGGGVVLELVLRVADAKFAGLSRLRNATPGQGAAGYSK